MMSKSNNGTDGAMHSAGRSGRGRMGPLLVAGLVLIGSAGVASPAAAAEAGAPIAKAAATVQAAVQAQAAPARTLRVYSNNIENLVRNGSNGSCAKIKARKHTNSMLVNDKGTAGGAKAPDILIFQQLRGASQAKAYADQLSKKFDYPTGTYKAIVTWSDPQEWGGSHKCTSKKLGNLKKKQTTGIIYNTKTLRLNKTAKYWSAGWLKPGAAYKNGKGCTLYKPPNSDKGATYKYKYKRTSAIAAQFKIKGTAITVFAATMHLPQENRRENYPCAGTADKGVGNTGIRLGAGARKLMNASAIRVIGMDANRTKIPANALSGYGVTGYGTKKTTGSAKIDYLFVRGKVQPSPIRHTVTSTRSTHKALYAFITY